MVHVLFVCLGNICRSPMAEAVFRDLVNKEGLADKIKIDSAGTGDWHVGHPPHEGTQKILRENDISFEGLRARQVMENDFSTFTYIITMDEKNIKDLNDFGVADENTYVGMLSHFVPHEKWRNVPDPYFTGDFDETYGLVVEGCQYLLATIKQEQML